MRSGRSSVVAILLAAAVGMAADPARLPSNPFANAKAGDWSVLVATSSSGPRAFMEWSVEKVEKGTVSVTVATIGSDGEATVDARRFETKTAPTIASYLGLTAGLEAGKPEDASLVAGERKFPGKTVSAKVAGGGEVVLGLSAEVTGSGLVTLLSRDARGRSTGWELAGFGTASKTTWGKRLAELARDGWSFYGDKANGFSLALPPAPVAKPEDLSLEALEVHAPSRRDGKSQLVYLTVEIDPREQSHDRDSSKTALKDELSASGKVLSMKDLTVSGHDAFLTDYSLGGTSSHGLDLRVLLESRELHATGSANEELFKGYEEDLRRAIASFAMGRRAGATFYDVVYDCSIDAPAFALVPAGESRKVIELGGGATCAKGVTYVAVVVNRKDAGLKEAVAGCKRLNDIQYKENKALSEKAWKRSGEDAVLIEGEGKTARASKVPSRYLQLLVAAKAVVYEVEVVCPTESFPRRERAIRASLESFRTGP